MKEIKRLLSLVHHKVFAKIFLKPFTRSGLHSNYNTQIRKFYDTVCNL